MFGNLERTVWDDVSYPKEAESGGWAVNPPDILTLRSTVVWQIVLKALLLSFTSHS